MVVEVELVSFKVIDSAYEHKSKADGEPYQLKEMAVCFRDLKSGTIKNYILPENLIQVNVNYLKKEGVSGLSDPCLHFLTSITHLHCADTGCFVDDDCQLFLGKMLGLMNQLQVIGVPQSISKEEYQLAVHYWQAIWDKEIRVVRVPDNDVENDDESKSVASIGSPVSTRMPHATRLRQALEQNNPDPFAYEEHAWEDLVHPRHNDEAYITPKAVVSVIAAAGSAYVVSTARPYMPSAKSFVGTIARYTVIPAARGLYNYVTGNK